MEKRFIKSLVAIGAAIMLFITFTAFAANTGNQSKKTIKGVVIEKPVASPYVYKPRVRAEGEEPPRGFGASPSTPAVFIDNGKYSAAKSKPDAVIEGDVGDNFVSGLKINAKEGNVGGVHVEGPGSVYTLVNATIDLSGDSTGLGGAGSGASASDYGTLIIKDSTITTRGENRNATSVQDHGFLKVYNSTLTSHGVPFVPVYDDTDQKKQLEIDGRSRTHCTLSNSYSYFYYCTVIAEGWAALSTDGARGFLYLEANHCTVKTLTAGYGTYADMGCHVRINDCDFDVANMAGILAGDSDITFTNTKAKCGTYFALMHSIGPPRELSYLTVIGGDIETKSPVVLVKSANVEIEFDGTKMVSESGILIKSVVAVDPNAAEAANTKGMDVYGIHATFKDMYVEGDIIHTEDKENRDMTVYLESTTLKGAIRDAYISINPRSKWIATANSNVTIAGNVDVSQIDAPAGVTITAVAGETGTYTLESGGTLILKAS